MIFLDSSFTELIKKQYPNLAPSTDHCRKCGKEVQIDKPVITKDFVGFESEPHECGAGFRISCLYPRNYKEEAL